MYISRGAYDARVAVPRILSMLDKYNIRATFFTTGYAAERNPDTVKEIHSRGHELAHHGYLHEAPSKLGLEKEKEILEKGSDILAGITGERPRGYRAPDGNLSPHSLGLLQEHGFLYDSTLFGGDFHLYYPEVNGEKADIVEIPITWELDDFPHFAFNPNPLFVGLSAPSKVYEIWSAEFEGAYKEEGMLMLMMHPEVIGRYHRLKMLERLIVHIAGHPGVWFATCAEVATDWLEQQK